MQLDRGSASNGLMDIVRVSSQVALSVGQPIAAYLSEWSGHGEREVERARRSDGPVSPAEGAFAIWGPLFAASTALAIWSSTPERRRDPALQRIGWLACATTASNVAWSINAQLSGLGWRSLGLIGAGAASSVAALIEAERRFARSPRARVATWAIGPLAGWLTLATFANLEATLNETRGRPTAGTEAQRAAALVGAASAAASGVAIAARGNLPFAGAVAWGLGGVVVRNLRDRLHSVTAAGCAGLLALAGLTLWARRRR